MSEPHRDAVRRLQEIAGEDLRVAHACLGLRPPAVRMAAFHSQQAVEKHLKAWLLALGEPDYPLTHNLSNLADLLAERGGPHLPSEPLRFLTRFAIAPRYEVAHLTQAEAEDAVAQAEQIVEQATRAVAALMGEEPSASA
ncbi:MAG: HEPN domain-containing protein [Armatimonadetes bacterium]|nr:HEPN domain-containing protein [Armatimonadota bacterium]